MPLKTSNPIAYPIFLILLPILFSLIILVGYTQAKHQFHEAGIRALNKQMNTVFRIIDIYNGQVKDGSLSLGEAELRLKDLLSGRMQQDGTHDLSTIDLPLGDGDYLFVFNSKGNFVMHPFLEGKSISVGDSPEGRLIIKDALDEGKSVISYQWEDPAGTETFTKLAVVRYYPQWDWYVCISTPEETFYSEFNQIKYLLLFLVVGSYVITSILYFLTRRKEKALRHSTILGEQLAQTNQSILKTLAVALEERDSYTSGHSQRVAYYMKVIAAKMGFSPEMLDTIYTGGLLHDIGKIGIEDSILLKPGRLTQEEYEIIKSHPLRGEALLRKLYAHTTDQDREKVDSILTITRFHHERYDGKGYPDQIKGEEIPLIARIAAVADSFDAMTSSRAYRKGLSFSKACQEILANQGTQFCPVVAEAFFQSVTEETFLHAHQITRADELLFDKMDEEKIQVQSVSQAVTT